MVSVHSFVLGVGYSSLHSFFLCICSYFSGGHVYDVSQTDTDWKPEANHRLRGFPFFSPRYTYISVVEYVPYTIFFYAAPMERYGSAHAHGPCHGKFHGLAYILMGIFTFGWWSDAFIYIFGRFLFMRWDGADDSTYAIYLVLVLEDFGKKKHTYIHVVYMQRFRTTSSLLLIFLSLDKLLNVNRAIVNCEVGKRKTNNHCKNGHFLKTGWNHKSINLPIFKFIK